VGEIEEIDNTYLLQLGFEHSSLEQGNKTWLKKVFQYVSKEDMQLSIDTVNSKNPFPRETKLYLGDNYCNFYYKSWKPYSLKLANQECYYQNEFLQIQPIINV
jgi:hypothetical protein